MTSRRPRRGCIDLRETAHTLGKVEIDRLLPSIGMPHDRCRPCGDYTLPALSSKVQSTGVVDARGVVRISDRTP